MKQKTNQTATANNFIQLVVGNGLGSVLSIFFTGLQTIYDMIWRLASIVNSCWLLAVLLARMNGNPTQALLSECFFLSFFALQNYIFMNNFGLLPHSARIVQDPVRLRRIPQDPAST